MPSIEVGGIVKGKVTGVENYGIFVLIDNNYTGLIHISEISDNFVKNVFDYVNVDEDIYSKVIAIDEDNKKLKLSIKNFNYRTGEDTFKDDLNGFKPLQDMLPSWIEEYKLNNNL